MFDSTRHIDQYSEQGEIQGIQQKSKAERLVDLDKLGKSLGAISKQLQIISSSLQTGLCKHNLSGSVTNGRMPKLSSSHKKKLVVECSGQTEAQICHELEAIYLLEKGFMVKD